MKPTILVVGSTNTDMVVKTSHLPGPGQTVLGGKFFMNAGGKGANQAVAAARLNGTVTFVAKTGADIFGSQAVEQFRKEGIDCRYILTDENEASGVALISVDAGGENCIVVAPGANAALKAEEVLLAGEAIRQSAIILVQLEIPLDTVLKLVQFAAGLGKRVILNPAPACALSDELLKGIYMITPNEKEAEMLTGIAVTDTGSALQAAKVLQSKGVQLVVVTLGEKGALFWDGTVSSLLPAPEVKAVDTTAAGDVFNGALAVALAEGRPHAEAILFANHAAALSVTKLGAQSSAPGREETERFMQVTGEGKNQE